MPRPKAQPKKSDASTSAANKKQSTPKNYESERLDSKFNDSELTMSQLKDMIKALSAEVFKKNYEALETDIQDEVEWRVTAQCEEMEETIESMKKEISSIKEEREELKVENRKMKRKIERCEYKLSRQTSKIEELETKIDEIEQKHLDRDIQIVGLPEIIEAEGQENSDEEEMKSIVKLVSEKMDMTLKANNIEKIYRLGKKKADRPRDVVVRFKTNITKNKIIKKRKSTINSPDPQKNVYINDHLTEKRRNILYATRRLVKQKRIFAAWSQQGNILIRLTENDPPVHIKSHEQLAELRLLDDISEPDPDHDDIEEDENDDED